MGRDLFSSEHFRYVNVFYVNSWQESQIRAQLMTYTIYKKDVQRNYNMVSELNSWFLWLRPIVFVKTL